MSATAVALKLPDPCHETLSSPQTAPALRPTYHPVQVGDGAGGAGGAGIATGAGKSAADAAPAAAASTAATNKDLGMNGIALPATARSCAYDINRRSECL